MHISINHKNISLIGREKDAEKRIYLYEITSETPSKSLHCKKIGSLPNSPK